MAESWEHQVERVRSIAKSCTSSYERIGLEAVLARLEGAEQNRLPAAILDSPEDRLARVRLLATAGPLSDLTLPDRSALCRVLERVAALESRPVALPTPSRAHITSGGWWSALGRLLGVRGASRVSPA